MTNKPKAKLSEERERKLEYIRTKYGDCKRIDPYMDVSFVRSLRAELVSAGLYKGNDSTATDSAIINLVLRVQGRYSPKNRTASGRA